jgi:hypothetical protein
MTISSQKICDNVEAKSLQQKSKYTKGLVERSLRKTLHPKPPQNCPIFAGWYKRHIPTTYLTTGHSTFLKCLTQAQKVDKFLALTEYVDSSPC